LSVTGARPRVPTKAELDQIRYTPITASFSRIAELSRQIAGRRGLTADTDASGDTKGALLDIAELWEIYVLKVLRKATAPLNVVHGTRENTATKHMLRSDVTGQVLGKLIPDAVLYDGAEVVAVADAKYKPLHPRPSAQYGPKREDLYQMGAYLGQFLQASRERSLGLLLYPSDPNQQIAPSAELASPWSLDRYKKIAFLTLPHDEAEAVAKLQTNLIQMGVYPDNWLGWQIRSKSTSNGHR
jgi:5-methylcytosine-specific restriction enzyme subunit McrC